MTMTPQELADAFTRDLPSFIAEPVNQQPCPAPQRQGGPHIMGPNGLCGACFQPIPKPKMNLAAIAFVAMRGANLLVPMTEELIRRGALAPSQDPMLPRNHQIYEPGNMNGTNTNPWMPPMSPWAQPQAQQPMQPPQDPLAEMRAKVASLQVERDRAKLESEAAKLQAEIAALTAPTPPPQQQ